jgi:hypothetical protein
MRRKHRFTAAAIIVAGLVSVGVLAHTCLHTTPTNGPCFEGDPQQPDLPGWNCQLDKIAKLFKLPGSCVGKSGKEYSTSTNCTITWTCKKPGEQSRVEETKQSINTDYDQEMGSSCICP